MSRKKKRLKRINNMFKDMVEKLLEEVDPDISELMLSQEREGCEEKNWQMLADPVQTILRWQELRDRKRKQVVDIKSLSKIIGKVFDTSRYVNHCECGRDVKMLKVYPGDNTFPFGAIGLCVCGNIFISR